MKIKYPKGTPCPSHEYYKDVFGDGYRQIQKRGFLVGCHSENISTFFNHPFRGESVEDQKFIEEIFGLENVEKLDIKLSMGRKILKKLPNSVRRKLRYLATEKKWILRPLFAVIYNILRS